MAGGPNPGLQDACSGYPSKLQARSYLDTQCSYSTNEICINWNTPMVYLPCAIESNFSHDGKPNVTVVHSSEKQRLSDFHLINYPNPFNAQTTIEFNIRESGCISLNVCGILGKMVAVLLDHEVMTAGNHRISFQAQDLPSRVYFYRFYTRDYVKTGKMLNFKIRTNLVQGRRECINNYSFYC